MGLDMFLRGKKYSMYSAPEELVDGFKVNEKTLELGYWRKHPNLHGYIVKTFALGVDECQEIELSAEDIGTIIEAINADKLPETQGFFFGKSDGSEKEGDLEVFTKAYDWLCKEEPSYWKSVIYQASW